MRTTYTRSPLSEARRMARQSETWHRKLLEKNRKAEEESLAKWDHWKEELSRLEKEAKNV